MALFVVATPIGNSQDLSIRARESLANADLVIGEELKVLRQTLKSAGVQAPATDELNEHSNAKDIEHFVSECAVKNVVLVSDCGTPGFCDPGAELVAACVAKNILVRPVPGASSLMCLLSVCGVRLERFNFHGFFPAKQEDRQQEIKKLTSSKTPLIVMETPYRSQKLREDLVAHFSDWHCVVGLNLTQENEKILRGKGKTLPEFPEKAEPIALLIPPGNSPR